jgi:leucine-zipper of insertion element IS481
MKLHANAALGPNGRLTMVRRAVEKGWSVTEAAEATGASVWGAIIRVGSQAAVR